MSMYGVNDQTIYTKQEELANRSRSKRFTELLREREITSRAYRGELGDEAKRSAADFGRHTAELNELVDAEIDTLVPTRGPSFDFTAMTVSNELLHVFGPHNYSLGWTHLDLGQANVNIGEGTFFAYNYTTGPARFTVAQLGAKLRPRLPVCKLSVRAYAQFEGYDILDHRVHDPDVPDPRRAWALGSVGVKVDSWALDGTDWNLDGEQWVDQWNRSEVNPRDSREYDGSLSVSAGLIVEPIAINTRDYAVWVTCRVGVSADPGFAVSTYATSSIAVKVPYFVVEEIEHW